jgi:alanyl-tRNA synthetase
VDDYSIEFCGGTHCDHTGEIGLMRITGESAVAAGVRRIEAVTGDAALEAFTHDREIVRTLSEELSAQPAEVLSRVASLKEELKLLQHELAQARSRKAGDLASELLDSAQEVGGIRLIARQVEVPDRESLVRMGDALRESLEGGVAVLAAALEGKAAFLAVVSDDLIASRGLKAGDLIKRVATLAGGTGGGRPHLAQAGGKDPARIPAAIGAVASIVEELIATS